MHFHTYMANSHLYLENKILPILQIYEHQFYLKTVGKIANCLEILNQLCAWKDLVKKRTV